jgi:hypothetical protein
METGGLDFEGQEPNQTAITFNITGNVSRRG